MKQGNLDCFKTDSAQRSSNSTVTFSMLFETPHFNSLLQVTPRLNSRTNMLNTGAGSAWEQKYR